MIQPQGTGAAPRSVPAAPAFGARSAGGAAPAVPQDVVLECLQRLTVPAATEASHDLLHALHDAFSHMVHRQRESN